MRLAPLQAVAQKTERKKQEQQKTNQKNAGPGAGRPLGGPTLARLSHSRTHPPYPSQSCRIAEAPTRGASTPPAGPGEGRRGRAGAGRQAPLPAPGGVAPGRGAAGAAPLKGGASAPPASPSAGTGAQVGMGGGHGSACGGGGRGGRSRSAGGEGACQGSAEGPVWGAGVLGGEEGEAVPAVLARGRWSVPEAPQHTAHSTAHTVQWAQQTLCDRAQVSAEQHRPSATVHWSQLHNNTPAHSAHLDTQPSRLPVPVGRHPGHCLLVTAPSAHHTTPRHGTARHGTAQGTARHGARHGTARHGEERHTVAQCSTPQHGAAPHGTTHDHTAIRARTAHADSTIRREATRQTTWHTTQHSTTHQLSNRHCHPSASGCR